MNRDTARSFGPVGLFSCQDCVRAHGTGETSGDGLALSVVGTEADPP